MALFEDGGQWRGYERRGRDANMAVFVRINKCGCMGVGLWFWF